MWRLHLNDGRDMSCRFLVTGLGLLGVAMSPRYPGVEKFKGQSFHTFDWPHEPVQLAGKRVGVIGTGATAIQLIADIADKVADLTVFQRRPNWAAPLNNYKISKAEMADIKQRYDDIFHRCSVTPGSSMNPTGAVFMK